MSIIVVGNKLDLCEERRRILNKTAANYAELHGFIYIEASAKTG